MVFAYKPGELIGKYTNVTSVTYPCYAKNNSVYILGNLSPGDYDCIVVYATPTVVTATSSGGGGGSVRKTVYITKTVQNKTNEVVNITTEIPCPEIIQEENNKDYLSKEDIVPEFNNTEIKGNLIVPKNNKFAWSYIMIIIVVVIIIITTICVVKYNEKRRIRKQVQNRPTANTEASSEQSGPGTEHSDNKNVEKEEQADSKRE
jgi:hypothetical protein